MSGFWMRSRKYDGSLHYRYPVEVVQHSEGRLTTYRAAGAMLESYRGSFITKRHCLSMFWRAKPYVLHVQWEEDWRPHNFYIDIATSTGWGEGTVGYVDMDLDLILPHASDAIHLDDEDEFEEHRRLWSYPDELVKGCHGAVEEVRGLLTRREKPFNAEMFAWRPGEALPD